MCGITGIFGLSDKTLIRKMNDRITHRGPDDEGYYVDDNVSLAMRRLSIIDLQTGSQPMYNEEGNLVIMFNGEIYNYGELRKELENKHTFKTKSDTEVIIHAFEEYGPECVKRFEGMFAFAIWDMNKKELFIARDRFGIKPLFYTFVEDKFVFGSEIKGIYQYDKVRRGFDLDSMYEKFLFGHCILESTLFDGIKQLLPGHILTISKHGFEIKEMLAYKLKPIKMDEKQAITKLSKLLEQAVERRLVSDVGFGIFLSGGIDSGLITAIACKVAQEPVKTFTIGCADDIDFRHARIVAEAFDTEHHEIDFFEDKFKVTADYCFALEDTEPHTTGPITLSKRTKKYSKMVLCGQAADETFGGYPKYKQISRHLGAVLEKWNTFKQIPKDKKRATQLFNYVHNFVIKLSSTDNFNNMLYYDMGSKLANLQLAPVDRTSMAYGLEVRVPFLDTNLIDFVCSIPPELKMKQNLEKYILRVVAPEFKLPKVIQDRDKYMSTMGKNVSDTKKIPLAQPKKLIFDDSVNKFSKVESGDYGRLINSINPRTHKFGRFFTGFGKERLIFLDMLDCFLIKNQGKIPKNFSLSDLY